LKVHNKFLVTLAVSYGIANATLAWVGQSRLEVYFIVDTILFLVVALVFNLNSRAMAAIRGIGAFLFLGFLSLVVLKIIEML
jgi:hypothetical protein